MIGLPVTATLPPQVLKTVVIDENLEEDDPDYGTFDWDDL